MEGIAELSEKVRIVASLLAFLAFLLLILSFMIAWKLKSRWRRIPIILGTLFFLIMVASVWFAASSGYYERERCWEDGVEIPCSQIGIEK